MNLDKKLQYYKSGRFLLLLLTTLLSCILSAQPNQIELKEGFFFINNEKFFIKGIGYEVGAIPGQLPWEREFDEDLLIFDVERILSAGFNTIRTWAPFSEDELNVLAELNIKIIMGIWIDPHGDFSDPEFISNAVNEVNNVLSYSKFSPNIIAYLIMNEPLPETVFSAGYDNTLQLFSQLIEIIHTEHPGIPVSIANTCNGTYINPAIFDFSAYNVYPYNPATVNFSHKYPAYIEYLKDLKNANKPLIITEYGLSVSPSGPGNWGYGGNSLQEQTEGVLYMYKSLIDGGATGSCLFNYSDGWWKGGNEFVHDDNPEEWFGLIEYQDLSDKYGVPRPVWDSVKRYNQALVVSPKNSGIYKDYIPVEIFGSDTVKSVKIYRDELLVYTNVFQQTYLADTIFLGITEMEDVILNFVFFNEFNNKLKEEQKSILLSVDITELPSIEITTDPEYLEEPGTIEAFYNISDYQDFSHSDHINYVFYPHIGWNYGSTFSKIYPQSITSYNFSNYHTFDDDARVITIAAGFDIYFNSFSKRIFDQITLPVQNSFGVKEYNNFFDFHHQIFIYPNPAKDYIKLEGMETKVNDIELYSLSGTIIKILSPYDSKIDITFLNSGIYFIRVKNGKNESWLKFIKLKSFYLNNPY